MKKGFKIIWLCLSSIFLLTACFEDKGIYKYHDINDIVIDYPAEVSIKIPKKDSVLLVLEPTITQLQVEGDANLEYLWTRHIGREWITCSETQVCSLWIKPTDRVDIDIRLAVTDRTQNIVSYKEMVVRLIMPYSRCWFVLQDINEQAVLGAIEGENGVRVITPDVYFEETGRSLSGKPLFLSINTEHRVPGEFPPVSRETVFQVFTEENSWMFDGITLQIRYEYDLMLLQKKIEGNSHYRPTFATADYGGIILDDGVMWYAVPDSYSIYYPVKLDAKAGDSYRATMASSVNRYINLVFDDEHKRFLSYSNNEWSLYYWTQQAIRGGNYSKYDINGRVNSPLLTRIGENAKFPNVFNPDSLGEDKQMLYMGATTDDMASRSIAIAYGQRDGQLHIYEFNTDGLGGGNAPACSGYFTISPIGGQPQDWSFASSSGYNRIFYYAYANKIYRIDLNRRVPKAFEIYSYPDPAVRITKLKFRSERKDIGKNLDDDLFEYYHFPAYLAAALDYGDGTGGLVEMKLTGGGEISKGANEEAIVYEFKGFKNIVDIGYAFR